jgi:anaerobic selenocysteine-containing dehydrogenase
LTDIIIQNVGSKLHSLTKQIIKTNCILCVWGYGINAYVEDGRLVRVEGMTEHPRDPITGYTELKALLCKISKVKE